MASCLTLQSSVLTIPSKVLTGKESRAFQYIPEKTYKSGKENVEESSKSKYGLHPSQAKLFSGKEIILELSAQLSGKDKRLLKNKITENGGKVSFVVSKCTDLMVCDSEHLATRKFNLALQYGVPIVTASYLHESLKQCKLLPFDKYLVTKKMASSAFDSGKVKLLEPIAKKRKRIAAVATPYVPCSSLQGYQLLKAIQLSNLTSLKPHKHGQKDDTTIRFYIIELHCQINSIQDDSSKYCVFTHEGILHHDNFDINSTTMLCRFFETVDDAMAVYAQLDDQMSGLPRLMKHHDILIHPDVGSPAFQSMQLERFELLSSLEPPVSKLVGTLWLEAVGHISEFLATKPSGIRPWAVIEAEGILLQILSVLGKCSDELLHKLGKEFYTILPHQHEVPLLEKRIVVQKLDLCQVLKDMIAVSEATGWAPRGDLDAKYRALHCRIRSMLEGSTEYEKIFSMVVRSQTLPTGITGNVKRIFEVQRSIEHAVFTHGINNQRLLFHCTMPSNLVGILSHGLLPPRLAVTKRGVERTDAGMLGSGIYFTDSISHAIKYSKPSKSGSRYLLVSMVALGDVYQVYEINPDLDAPPENYNSVQGVKSTNEKPSDFSGNEFVIYSSSQQKLCYLVEFRLPENGDLEFEEGDASIADCEVVKESGLPSIAYSYDLSDFSQDKPRESSCGLKLVRKDGSTSWSSNLALEAVHVRAQIQDTVARVVLLQVYKNHFPSDIEVKFVFPLELGAAICGFEAFIGGKHIRGEVKEKETAHKEYKQAISEGHGAYLLDEDRPDVFTVHVGNLPSKTTAVIKISYITELPVERDAVRFTLPSSVSPWQNVTGMQSSAKTASAVGEFTIQASLEMASDIISIHSPSHKIRSKKTKTKAVIELETGSEWGGVFILYARLKDAHAPRMWVEKHPEKDSEACMLTFYPEFEVNQTEDTEIVLMLDASNSMVGSAFQDAIRICLLLLNELSLELDSHFRFNVVAFGSFFKELYPRSKPFTRNVMEQAEAFLKLISPDMGNTDLHRLLRTYNLLTSNQVNVFVVSDGHIGEEGLVTSLSAQNFHVRVFTLATSQTANKHLLRTISSHTGGAFETFDPTESGVWKDKVKQQVKRAQQPALSNISVDWQQFKDGSQIAQAPRKITSLFSGDCLVVYGFVSNCTMATLKASLQQQEFSTIVSTSELSKTNGNLIHSLVARGIVRDWEDGPLDDDSAVHWLRKRNSRSLVVELAKEHSLVTSLTSFLAVEKRTENEIIEDVPHISELLDQENVDVLPYMEYKDFHTQEEKTTGKDDDVEMMLCEDIIMRSASEALEEKPSSRRLAFGGGGARRHRKVITDADQDDFILDQMEEVKSMPRRVVSRYRPMSRSVSKKIGGTLQQKKQKQSSDPHGEDYKLTSSSIVEYSLEPRIGGKALADTETLDEYCLEPLADTGTMEDSAATFETRSFKMLPFLDEIWSLSSQIQPALPETQVAGLQMAPGAGMKQQQPTLFGLASYVQQPTTGTLSGVASYAQQPTTGTLSGSATRHQFRPRLFAAQSQIQQPATQFGAPSRGHQKARHFYRDLKTSIPKAVPHGAEVAVMPCSIPPDPSQMAGMELDMPIVESTPLLESSPSPRPAEDAMQRIQSMRQQSREDYLPVMLNYTRLQQSEPIQVPMNLSKGPSVPQPVPVFAELYMEEDGAPGISEAIISQPQEGRNVYHYSANSKLRLQADTSLLGFGVSESSSPLGFGLFEDSPNSAPLEELFFSEEQKFDQVLKKKKKKTKVDHHDLFKEVATFYNVLPQGKLQAGKVGLGLKDAPKQTTPAITFVENIISWKGGGLPICSALFAEVKKRMQKRGMLLSELVTYPSANVQKMLGSKEENILTLLEKHGLHSLGVTISEQVVGFVLKLAYLYTYLLDTIFPIALENEDSNDFDAVVKRASKILVLGQQENEKWVSILKEVNEINMKFPLIYSNLELGKSWEEFLMRKCFYYVSW